MFWVKTKKLPIFLGPVNALPSRADQTRVKLYFCIFTFPLRVFISLLYLDLYVLGDDALIS